MSKVIDAAAKAVRETLDKHAAEIETLEKNRAAEQAKADTIRAAMTATEQTGDIDAYEREAAKLAKAQTRADFFSSAIEHKKAAHHAELLELAEKVTKELLAEVERLHAEDVKEFCKAARQISERVETAGANRRRAGEIAEQITEAAGLEWTASQAGAFAPYNHGTQGRMLINDLFRACNNVKVWEDSNGTRHALGPIPDGVKAM